MNEEKLKLLITEVRNPEASKTSLDIYGFIKRHKFNAMHKFVDFIKIFEDFFHEMNIVIYYINFIPKNNWKNHKGIQYLFFPPALKTLHCSFENAMNGYYDESIMLCRSVYETFLRIVFLSCYPNEWEAVYHTRKGKVGFNVTSFSKDHLKINWESIYKIMCWTSHSNIFRCGLKLKKILEKQDDKNNSLEYCWDKKALAMAINNITLTLSCLFHAMLSIFEEDLKNYPELVKIKKIDAALIGIIEINPKESFSALSKDIRKIGKIIKIAASGEDWKKVI